MDENVAQGTRSSWGALRASCHQAEHVVPNGLLPLDVRTKPSLTTRLASRIYRATKNGQNSEVESRFDALNFSRVCTFVFMASVVDRAFPSL